MFVAESVCVCFRRRPSRYSYAPLLLGSAGGAGGAGGAGSGGEAYEEVKSFTSNPWFALNSPPSAAPLQLTLEPQARACDSPGAHTFEPDENSAYFDFFRGIHNDYQELPAKKQRLFRRECLAFLHRLLDEDEPAGQQDALNLSHAYTTDTADTADTVDSDDERDCKPLIIDREDSYGDRSNGMLEH